MTIKEMHNTFRTIGQQMGMQLIRAILPKSIDVFLNSSIIDTVYIVSGQSVENNKNNELLMSSSSMGAINSLRTLYKSTKVILPIGVELTNEINDEGIFKDSNTIIDYIDDNIGYHRIIIPTISCTLDVYENTKINPMMLLGFSLGYNGKNNVLSNCRLLGKDVVDLTLDDFCNSASKENPIVSLTTVVNNDSYPILDIYTNTKGIRISCIDVKYIKKPNTVKYDEDDNNCVNCDLPEHLHHNIVERAVQKYLISINAQMPTANSGTNVKQ